MQKFTGGDKKGGKKPYSFLRSPPEHLQPTAYHDLCKQPTLLNLFGKGTA